MKQTKTVIPPALGQTLLAVSFKREKFSTSKSFCFQTSDQSNSLTFQAQTILQATWSFLLALSFLCGAGNGTGGLLHSRSPDLSHLLCHLSFLWPLLVTEHQIRTKELTRQFLNGFRNKKNTIIASKIFQWYILPLKKKKEYHLYRKPTKQKTSNHFFVPLKGQWSHLSELWVPRGC